MRQAVLLGNPDTKRTHYLGRAAREAGLHVLFLDWGRWREGFPEGEIFLKIDPPVWDSCLLGQLPGLVRGYREQLEELEGMKKSHKVEFLNDPGAIGMLLDKQACKARLAAGGIAVTEELGAAGDAGQLLEMMQEQRIFQVFLKPVCGSGAAGVAAFRWHPKSGKMVLYTCAWEAPGKNGTEAPRVLVNTKRLRRITDSGQVLSLVGRILELGCIVEQWYAKAEYQGYSYDLRAVVQDGRMDFCLARLSRGPITNLHLNNHPLEQKELGLPQAAVEEAERLCRNAMGCFPGLRSAGIDVLLERGSLKPRVIEMNAQGDLIYQDIYGENVIYRRQAEMMAAACAPCRRE
ncbi:MAG: hypothetical protein HFG59_01705 [Lachnospiraceae bacterium]|nr:hypothetical protein [Lachnospiraceae bacterium]